MNKQTKNRRQLSCDCHSYKEAKQGSKIWLKAREVSEPSLLSVLSFGKLSVLSYEHTEEQVIHEADWKVIQILVEIVGQGRNT